MYFRARKEKSQIEDRWKIELKQFIENLDLLNSNLQSKINYFYQPYKCAQMKNYLIPMTFEENDPLSELDGINPSYKKQWWK